MGLGVGRAAARRRGRLGAVALASLVFLSGVLLSVWLSAHLRQQEEELDATRFQTEAHERVELVKRALEERLRVVGALRAFYAASYDVEPHEFQTFARSFMELYPALDVLAWVQRVPAERRAEHEAVQAATGRPDYRIAEWDAEGRLVAAAPRDECFPLVYAVPRDDRYDLVGFDLGTQPECLDALRRAEKTNEPAAVAVWMRCAGREPAALVCVVLPAEPAPLPPDAPQPDSPADRSGFVLSACSLQMIVDRCVGIGETTPMDVFLYAGPAADGNPPMAARLVRAEQDPPTLESLHDAATHGGRREHVAEFDVGGQAWSVRCAAADDSLWAAGRRAALLVLLGGIAISALAAGYLLLLLHGKGLAERLAQQRSATLETISNSALDAVIMMDPEGNVAHWNPAAERIFGHRRDEILGRNVHELLVPERYREEARRGLRQFFTTGEGPVVGQLRELEALRKDGAEFPIEVSVSAVRLEGRWWAMAIIRDITARRRAEEAIRQQQRLLRELLDLHERDRKLIAYEIHDGLAQQLAGALMRLQTYAAMPDKIGDNGRATLADALRVLGEAVAETRRLIGGLRPAMLEEAGIVAALRELAAQHERRGGPAVEFHADVQFDRLVPPLESAVYRIVQECLTNAARHSGSPRVRVALVQVNGRLRVTVEDWGCGFDPEQVSGEHFGVRGIRERARLLGGAAEIDAAPGKGARVTVELPIVEEETAA
jgi:PAS domain S-box-containing protein